MIFGRAGEEMEDLRREKLILRASLLSLPPPLLLVTRLAVLIVITTVQILIVPLK